MLIAESHLNATEGYRFSEDIITDLADTYMGEDASIGEIFRASQKEHGRCTGKVYIDTRTDKDPPGKYPRTIHVGWVFEKLDRYEDTGEPYKHETWITLLDKDETIRVRKHHEIGGKS